MIRHIVLCSLLFLTGCGLLGGSDEDDLVPVDIREITLSVTPGTHEDSPVRIDLVLVDDIGLFNGLIRLDSSAWFAGEAETFIATHPLVTVERYEIVPGTDVGPFDIAPLDDVLAALFCEIPGDGSGVQRVVTDGSLLIRVDDEHGCFITSDPDR